MTRLPLIAMAAAACAGCTTTVERVVPVHVPVPIACQAQEPTRPDMDTETQDPAAPIDQLARAMRAEIERREGYEGELRAALRSCTTPPPTKQQNT